MIIQEAKSFYVNRKTKIVILSLIILIIWNVLSMGNSGPYNQIYNDYYGNFEQVVQEPLKSELLSEENSSYLVHQVEYIMGFHNDVNEKIKDIESKKESGLFDAERDMKNLDEQLRFYKTLQGDDVKIERIAGIEKTLSSSTNLIYVIVIAIIIATYLFYDDVEQENLVLYKTTRNSLRKLFVSKMIVFLVTMAAIVIILAIVDTILLGNSNFSIHSLPQFREVVSNYSVMTYNYLKYFIIFISASLITVLYLFLLLFFRHRTASVTTLLTLLFIQMFMYTNISWNSNFAKFKYINIYYSVFKYYGEFNIYSNIIYIFLVASTSSLFILVYLLYTHMLSSQIKFNKRWTLRTSNLMTHTCYQLFVSSGSILIVLIIMVFSLSNTLNFSVSSKSSEASYQKYKSQYLGEISDNFREDLRIQAEEMNQINQIKSELLDKIRNDPESSHVIYNENYEIFEKAMDSDNLFKLISEVERSDELGISKLIDERGAIFILTINQPYFLVQNLVVLLGLMFIAGYFQEKNSKKNDNLNFVLTSHNGMKGYVEKQNYSLLVLAIISSGILLVMHLYKISSLFYVDFTNTLKDLLIINLDISLQLVLVLIFIALIVLSYISSKAGYIVSRRKIKE